MEFKIWFEGEYGTSAAGPVGAMYQGSTIFQSPNDETFAKRGVRSNYVSLDMQKKLPPKTKRQPLGNVSG